jgi:hypothetical protein
VRTTVTFATGSDAIVFTNGVDSTTIEVFVRDSQATPLAGVLVFVDTIIPSAANIAVNNEPAPGSSVLTGTNGRAAFVIKGTGDTRNIQFIFRAGGVLLSDAEDKPIVEFVSGTPTFTPTPTGQAGTVSPTNSTVFCNFTQAPINFTVNMNISLRDTNNQAVANHAVSINVSPTTAGLSVTSPNNFVSDSGGNIAVNILSSTVTAPNPVTFTVTAISGTPQVTLAQTCQITFTASGTPVAAGTRIGGTGTPIGTAVVTATRTPDRRIIDPGQLGPILGEVVAYRLRVRTGPGLQYQIIGLLRYRVKITLVGRNRTGTWLLVKLADNSEAWVSSRWVRVSRRAFRALPVVVVATLPPTN